MNSRHSRSTETVALLLWDVHPPVLNGMRLLDIAARCWALRSALSPNLFSQRLEVIAWFFCKRSRPRSIRTLKVTLKLARSSVVVKAVRENFSRSLSANFFTPFNITHNLPSSGVFSPAKHTTPSLNPAAATDRVPWQIAISPHFPLRSQ